MCTYDGGAYLGEQLASIAAQTRPPDELVVCDDCSADDTRKIVDQFARAAAFPVRLYVNEKNLGSTRNFERAVELCQGELIALADQDDVWHTEKLRRIEEVFDAAPDVALVFTDAEVVDENLRPLGRSLWELVGFDRGQQELLRRGRALDVLLPGWTVTGATMAFRARHREMFLPIPRDISMIHDGWIASVISAVAEIAFIDERLILYRQHPRQQVGAPAHKGQEGAEVWSARWGEMRVAVHRANPYAEVAEVIERLTRHLSERDDYPNRARVLEMLNARLEHLRARSSMPSRKASRLPVVLRELLARRYHRFSKGMSSAVKDLLA
jgi:glycosyltransferase involved in cell wall biosynthesis